MPCSYILCATPRSGTTLLCDLLAQTGVTGRPNSYYRSQNVLEWAQEWGVPVPHRIGDPAFEQAYLDAVRRVGTAETGMFGLRLMWGTVAELRQRLRIIFADAADDAALFEKAFGEVSYIYLKRLDTVAQAISRLRAEQSGLWHRSADGSDRERAAPSAPETYSADLIASLVREAETDNLNWNAWFAAQGIEPLRLTYEELSAAPQTTLATVLKALGQNPAIAASISVQTAKLADATSREWAERFRRSPSP
ncbi:MAG: Stf0 family sulfotransferase [Rhizobiaceae bacterium]